MTFYTVHCLASQYNLQLATQFVTVCDLASDMTGTSAELVVGDTLTVEQLLYGLMLPSGNDAAVALA
jgi:D-alanyl-D-alanine carboxypeptidase